MYKLHRPVARRALILSRYIIQLRRIVLSFTHAFTLALAFTYPAYTHTHAIDTLQQILVRSNEHGITIYKSRSKIRIPRSACSRSPPIPATSPYDEILRGHGANQYGTCPAAKSFVDIEIYNTDSTQINSILEYANARILRIPLKL